MADKNNWQSPRGTYDILPDDYAIWRFVRAELEHQALGSGYGYIDTPIFEDPAVFKRTLGETSDVVTKEMFEVRRSSAATDEETSTYTLRPELTAPVARAYVEHGMHTWPQPVKLWYLGPLFRADRPQKGRYRQFWTAGFEVLGDAEPTADALVIYQVWQTLKALGLKENLIVDVNSLGDEVCRPKYRKALVAYYTPHKDELCEACKVRLEKNPLRLLDCKEEGCVALKKDAPQLIDNLCAECREHFRVVLESLDELGIQYELTPSLVRGFDYYTRTAFEIREATDERRQSSLAGGGRYDNLLEQFGARPTPAMGVGFGLDRIIDLLREREVVIPELSKPTIFVIQLGETAKKNSFSLIARLGDAGYPAICQPGNDSLKNQMGLANRSGARYALIIGQREALDGTVILRDMQEATQETLLQKEVVAVLKKRLG